jgi:hypothetical protein
MGIEVVGYGAALAGRQLADVSSAAVPIPRGDG